MVQARSRSSTATATQRSSSRPGSPRAPLENDPMRLGDFRAQPEQWDRPAATPEPVAQAPVFARALQRRRLAAARAGVATPAPTPTVTPSGPAKLKLFQPAHQRYYMV